MARSLVEHSVEAGYLTVTAGVLALPAVALGLYLLDRSGRYSDATATAVKVGIGTAVTFLIVRQMHNHA